ncbi:AMP-activated serine/threonine-protein kinase regulatory subunit [Coemansia sp. RSA 2706]|nr:AMP-activated serine/threonine-protein kinase regulatory subunit [Coemansia sp. RSA 2711]KAJ2307603.1 AMP-activated serine/threonine-protein kinase regulatory subunit [Coemansia sp. RSA 2706]KAJ2320067.1 AMP-activated serine/threonine-protein kinase regulatory subunit [Coemansia sp. RSA 2704]KAJ2327606.1 AMP-activated serine/threonine-protein kinase regulatory subunit [Coemansia sp. RSA 2702]KAJ2737975.1 AMP-activated serine/threonine-protein kinase regulatory subunit [Coemansia sp. Cherry 4
MDIPGAPGTGGKLSAAAKRKELAQIASFFLKQHSAYDMIPVSFRLIVLDTKLLVTKALSTLVQNGVESAPMYDGEQACYAGMLTTTDLVNLIQYYYSNFSYSEAIDDLGQVQLENYKDLLMRFKSRQTNTLCANPLDTLYEISRRLLATDYSTLALVDEDSETGNDVIVSVLSIYRILNFMAVNVDDKKKLKQHSLYDLEIGTYGDLVTATMDVSVIDIIRMFVDNNISVVPILDDNGVVLNVFAESDIILLAREGLLDELNIPVSEALALRPDDYPGVHTCTQNDTLFSVLDTIRKTQVQRLIVVDENTRPVGVVALSDVLRALTI